MKPDPGGQVATLRLLGVDWWTPPQHTASAHVCLPIYVRGLLSPKKPWKGHFQPSNISKKKGGEMGVENSHADASNSTLRGQLRGESHGYVTVNWHGGSVCRGLPTCVFSRNTILPSAFNFRIYVSLLCNSTVHYFFSYNIGYILLFVFFLIVNWVYVVLPHQITHLPQNIKTCVLV